MLSNKHILWSVTVFLPNFENSLQDYSNSLVSVSIQPLDSPRRAEQVKYQLLINMSDAFFPKKKRNDQAMKSSRQQ